MEMSHCYLLLTKGIFVRSFICDAVYVLTTFHFTFQLNAIKVLSVFCSVMGCRIRYVIETYKFTVPWKLTHSFPDSLDVLR